MSWRDDLVEWSARRQAARWLVRELGGDRGRDLRAFERWRRARPQNAAAYARLVSHLPAADGVRRRPPVAAAWPAPRLAASVSFVALLLTAVAGVSWPPQVQATTVGEQRLVALPDGGTLRLDTDTRVLVAYGWRRRTVHLLEGRARATVPADARPFALVAGPVSATSWGGALDAQRLASGVELIALAGTLTVALDGETATVRPGEAMRSGAGLRAGPADLAAARGWPAGRLVFTDRSLAEVAAAVSRYSQRPIVILGETTAHRRVTASFAAGDTRGTARILATSLDLELATRGEAWVLGPRQKSVR